MRLWFRKLYRRLTRPRLETRVTHRVVLTDRMTLQDWQKSEARILEARKRMTEQHTREMFAVLIGESPQQNSLIPRDATDALINYGKIIGYQRALDVLIALAEFPSDPVKHIEASYGADEILKEEGLMTPEGELR